MNPRAAGLIVLVAVVALGLVAWLVVRFLARSAGIRRGEYRRMKKERDLMVRAILLIEERADLYLDLESVLATDVRRIIRKLDADRMELTE